MAVDMKRTVAIIGAGPSGLVAAKYLLRAGFKVTIFDPKDRVGGLWPVQKDEAGGLVHPLMVANQSKHTVQFSDLAWDDEGAQFPRAWQVGRYLERYKDSYCKDAELRLGFKVAAAEPLANGGEDGQTGTNRWRLSIKPSDGQDVTTHETDYLVVASGFFGQPAIPASFQERKEVPVIHSSAYRNLEDLLPTTDVKRKRILIVGGQMSGVEVAGTIATHLSSATHSPGPTCIPSPERYSVHHLIQRPVWVFPLYTSPNPTSPAPPFLPLDLSSYNLSNRPLPLSNSQGHISPEAARKSHAIFKHALGTDQSNFSRALTVQGKGLDDPAYLAVSDTYMDFVRSGLIKVSEGKLESVDGDKAVLFSSEDEQLDDLAAIVLATGFDASSSLSFFPQSVLDTLSFSPTDQANPVALSFHGTHHAALPTLGFVGFYRSPYWGVMEMQARFIAKLWSAPLTPSMSSAIKKDTSNERALALRDDPRMAQFPMGDYAYLMQEFAAALDMQLSPPTGDTPPLPPTGKGMDILTPARYADGDLTADQQSEMDKALQQTYETAMKGLNGNGFVAKAVFRSLLGEWKLERDIASQLPSHPSGHFSGTAKFLLREGTVDGRESALSGTKAGLGLGMEYLYIEEGDFKAYNGFTFRATRRYVYRYDEQGDKLSVWFVKTDDQKRADYLFHEVNFAKPEDEKKGWTATAGHLCIDDFYDVKYQFGFQAVNLKDWRISYSVKGPKKDYTIDSIYTR